MCPFSPLNCLSKDHAKHKTNSVLLDMCAPFLSNNYIKKKASAEFRPCITYVATFECGILPSHAKSYCTQNTKLQKSGIIIHHNLQSSSFILQDFKDKLRFQRCA